MEADPYIGTTFYFNAAPQVEDAPRGGNGSQVLPVADLDDDFDGVPEDGMEYLFLVRREASNHAKVTRASQNPYETVEALHKKIVPERVHSSRPSEEWRSAFVDKFRTTRMRMAMPPPPNTMPEVGLKAFPPARQESAWRVLINGKRSKPTKLPVQEEATITSEVTSATTGENIEMNDLEAAKAAILASLELDTPEQAEPKTPPSSKVAAPPIAAASTTGSETVSSQTPEYDKLPQLPTPSLIVSIPRTSLIHVLSHFNDWYTDRLELYEQESTWTPSTIFAPTTLRRKPGQPTKRSVEPEKDNRPPVIAPLPTPHEVHWMLSLLSRLNELLDGDDLSSLRLLAKTLVEMVEVSEKAVTNRKSTEVDRANTMTERRVRDEEDEARARCWMVIAAIAGVWKQEDLWNVNL
ncbi:SIP1 domain-containing protein [Sporobolomyces koalae]|uniref:SIP1 domain-containing protein n=1 Tax=Sporobolomyces koalae TaxID=500713 RepID=UPI0031803912